MRIAQSTVLLVDVVENPVFELLVDNLKGMLDESSSFWARTTNIPVNVLLPLCSTDWAQSSSTWALTLLKYEQRCRAL
jgi:hypothetical protein